MVNLIINACLSEPPTESLYFRYLTLVARKNLDYNVLIESERELKDLYFKFLREKGAMDFENEIIAPEDREDGVRIDISNNYSKTIIVGRIDCSNVINLIGQISFFRNLK